MAGQNDFKAFATDPSARVITQAAYVAAAWRSLGFDTGIAVKEQLNKVWRQGAAIAAAIGQMIADQTGLDALDDGNISVLVQRLLYAISSVAASNAGVYVVATGTANALVITPTPALQSYTAGRAFLVKAIATNSGAATINVSGLGVKSIRNMDGTTLLAGEIQNGGTLLLLYDGTNFVYLNAPYAATPAPGNSSGLLATTAFVGAAVSATLVYRYYAATSATPLDKGTFNFVDTTAGPVTLPLPATPAVGDALTFCDAAATWGSKNFTVGRNGNTIMGLAEDSIADMSDIQFSIIWNGSDWRFR